MSERRWTPGPWSVAKDADPDGRPSPFYRGIVALVSTDPLLGVTTSATVVTDGRTAAVGEWEANADLIAAAPALYEACEWLLDRAQTPAPSNNEGWARLESARAAIAAARGER